jgi:spermidine synthase
VIAVFMGGLGLGGLLLGARIDRQARPLRFYALLELGVAAAAAASPALLALARSAYLGLGGSVVLGTWGGSALRLLLAALVLLPPTLLAGGTLGAAARAIEADQRRRGTALLYGVNTLGALSGCLLSTFWLLEAFGTRGTLWLASATNALIAAVAWGLARGLPPVAVEEARPAAAAGSAPRFVLAAAAVVGFAFFLLELVWYRMLGPILGGTVYTFGLVLAMALFGIASGGLLYPPLLGKRAASLSTFALTCLLEAAAVAVPYALGDWIALLALSLRPPPGALLGGYVLGWTIVTAIVVLPASLVAGAQFPLLVALLGQGREQVARHVGRAYFWNTVGGIAGALAGGFGLLPILTAPGCWYAVSQLLLLLALAALVAARERSPRLLVPAGALALVVALLALGSDGPSAAWRHSSIGVGRASAPPGPSANARRAWINDQRRSIAWEQEGVESSVAVQTLAGLSFVVNGKVDGNARNDAPTQVASGLLGALLRPGAQRALVIGLGTGSTAGWLAELPGLQRVDVVELEPAILEVARLCAPVNRAAMDNPKLRVLTGDAREVLMAGRDRYDLIFSEPSNPYRAGIASLFTREFYEAAAARLTPDGLFLQWVQAYEVDEGTVSTIVATLAEVLPEVEVWQVHQIDLMLVASRKPLRHEAEALRARLREQPFRSGLLSAWRATELEDVLARFVASPALARRLRASGQPLNTDDRNPVEFSFAKTLSRSGLFDVLKLRKDAAAMGAGRPELTGAVDWERAARQRLAIYTIAGSPPPTATDAPEPERLRAKAHAQYVAGDLKGALDVFAAQPHPPEGAVETALFAEGLADRGDQAAVRHIQELRATSPVEAEAATARLALRLGQLDLARNALASAFVHYRDDPWPSQIAMAHALSLADELATAKPDALGVLFEALRQPFAVAALEEPRRLVLLNLAARVRSPDLCREALQALEPHVPWRGDVLRYRAGCYERQKDERAALAREELQEFLAQEPAAARAK